MNKNIIIGIVAVVVVVGGIYWFSQSQLGVDNLLVPLPSAQSPAPAPVVAPVPFPTPAPVPISQPVTHNITIQNFAFSPASITIKKGDTVIWTNKDSMGHTVTGDNGGPSSPTINANGTYSYTFNSDAVECPNNAKCIVGLSAYHCAIHPSMKGTVVVTQ